MSARPLLAALLFPALLLSAASAADSKSNAPAFTLSMPHYIKAFQGQCNQVGKNMKPVESSFTDKFAPDCGVQAATLAKITGRLLSCQSNYASPNEAFNILIDDTKSLQVLHSKNHTEVGAAVSGTDGGGPYFWCVLFSDGKPSTSFKVEGGEVPKTAMHPGCFSGNNDDCMGPKNGAVSSSNGLVNNSVHSFQCLL
ncbi:hypothetical protein PR202_gb02987 [Eleusine coracana subsp. coracana]|uniref:Uncharacterized protein n=1 Tax=Eleusine coracana subsp. coracana TaxID=191504 RepID=A0AAV5E018_ELECO|nr:hypothetical protein PR202_gb02987 [Eleusine coracana subsp. coracana]